jgi:hypothetical protein
LEAIQNADDAMRNMEKPYIKIQLKQTEMRVIDKGDGFQRIEDFQIFGNEPDIGIEKRKGMRGKFHVGRGQIIMMGRSLDNGYRDVEFHTQLNNKPWRFFNINIEDLSFEDEKLDYDPKGTIVIVRNNFNVDLIEDYIKRNLVFFPVPIYLNEKKITLPFSKEVCRAKYTIDMDNSTVYYTDNEGQFYFYDRGIYVAHYNIIDGFSGRINTKKPLRLNFARNDVMSNDKEWIKITQKVRGECFDLLINKPSELLTPGQRNAIYKKARHDPKFRDKIWNKKVIALANDAYITLRDIMKVDKIYYAERHSRLADTAIIQGYKVIVDEPELKRLLTVLRKPLLPVSECPVKDIVYKEVKPAEIEKSISRYLEEYTNRAILWGVSNRADAWTDGKTKIWLNRKRWDVKNFNDKKQKKACIYSLLKNLAHEMGHTSDNRDTDAHGIDFKLASFEAYKKIMDRFVKKELMG